MGEACVGERVGVSQKVATTMVDNGVQGAGIPFICPLASAGECFQLS